MLIAETFPDFVYKYMSASRAAQLIRSPSLYMAPSFALNDLYDFNIRGFWEENQDTKLRVFAKRMLLHGIEDDFERALKLARECELETVSNDYDEWLADNTPSFNRIMEHSGVTCFSSLVNNQRMWGTYGMNHTGAVVEFHTDVNRWAMAADLRCAIYTDRRLPICPSRLIKITKDRRPALDFDVLRMLLCTKHKDWSDERGSFVLRMIVCLLSLKSDYLIRYSGNYVDYGTPSYPARDYPLPPLKKPAGP
jgi:hypothetical protein